MSHPIAVLNTSIITNPGSYHLLSIDLEDVKELIKGQEVISAIGHQSTADILTVLFEREIPMNRIQFAQQIGQSAVVFKLRGRAPEGMILSEDEIKEIGFDFFILQREK